MRGVRLRAAALAAAAMGVSTGCVPTFDDNLSTVSETKVLAVQSEPAEAAPGESVHLSALVATPDVHGGTPKLTWGLCTARKPLSRAFIPAGNASYADAVLANSVSPSTTRHRCRSSSPSTTPRRSRS